jgi:hypothetical protein
MPAKRTAQLRRSAADGRFVARGPCSCPQFLERAVRNSQIGQAAPEFLELFSRKSSSCLLDTWGPPVLPCFPTAFGQRVVEATAQRFSGKHFRKIGLASFTRPKQRGQLRQAGLRAINDKGHDWFGPLVCMPIGDSRSALARCYFSKNLLTATESKTALFSIPITVMELSRTSRTMTSLCGCSCLRYSPASKAISFRSRYERVLPSTLISKQAPICV